MSTDSKSTNSVTILLTIGVGISFLIFIFCVVIYILKSYHISTIINSMKCNTSITQNDISAFEALQAYYKDATNFNIISLLYFLISSLFIGAIALYAQNLKERLDNFDEKRKILSEDIVKYKVTSKNNNKLTRTMI